jgi:hypothetical protein
MAVLNQLCGYAERRKIVEMYKPFRTLSISAGAVEASFSAVVATDSSPDILM